jgi:hypothetical protein
MDAGGSEVSKIKRSGKGKSLQYEAGTPDYWDALMEEVVEEIAALRLALTAAEAREARLRAQLERVTEWIDDLQDGGATEHALEIKADCLDALATGEQG